MLLGTGPLGAEVLITQREAKLSDDDTLKRGTLPGPKVLLVSPKRGAGAVKSPVALEIRFEPRGDVGIDLNSLAVTYMKTPPVDLTERVKEFVRPDGIVMPTAEIPLACPGFTSRSRTSMGASAAPISRSTWRASRLCQDRLLAAFASMRQQWRNERRNRVIKARQSIGSALLQKIPRAFGRGQVAPVVASHSRAVPSPEAVTTRKPSGAKTAELTKVWCPLEHCDGLPARDIPQTGGVIGGRRYDARAVGRKGGGLDVSLVPAQLGHQRTGPGIPQPRGAIRGSGQHERAVGRKGDRIDGVSMFAQERENDAALGVPNSGGAVGGRGRHARSVGREHDARDTPWRGPRSTASDATGSVFHNRATCSWDPVASLVPSGEKAAEWTRPPKPPSTATAVPLFGSHIRAALSSEAVTTPLPRGEKPAKYTGPA